MLGCIASTVPIVLEAVMTPVPGIVTGVARELAKTYVTEPASDGVYFQNLNGG